MTPMQTHQARSTDTGNDTFSPYHISPASLNSNQLICVAPMRINHDIVIENSANALRIDFCVDSK